MKRYKASRISAGEGLEHWIDWVQMLRLYEEMVSCYSYSKHIRVGATGGVGTAEAAAAAFVLGSLLERECSK